MLSVGLHLRMIGRAGRIAVLERVLRHMREQGGAWFARRHSIARFPRNERPRHDAHPGGERRHHGLRHRREEDIADCARTGTRICHNCSSNLRLMSGPAPVNRFRAHGIPVALGIDEAGINDDRGMLQEMRLVLRAHRQPGIDAPSPGPAAVLRMAAEHGAATAPFAARIGALRPGMAADLLLLGWHAVTWPYQSPDLPPVDVLVQRARTGAVRLVMIGGEVVFREGRFTRLDRDAVLAEIAERMGRPLPPAEEGRRAMAEAVMPHMRRFYDGCLATR